MKAELIKALDSYGDAMFECGAWTNDDVTPYETVSAEADKQKAELIMEADNNLAELIQAVEHLREVIRGASLLNIHKPYGFTLMNADACVGKAILKAKGERNLPDGFSAQCKQAGN